jgi:hypothetical protein
VTFGQRQAHCFLTLRLGGATLRFIAVDHNATSRTASPGALPHRDAASQSPIAAFPSLIQTASLEFRASVHLLAERARFLTGATGTAIAIKDGVTFKYCASSGRSVPETGSPADRDREVIRKCLETKEAASSAADKTSFILAVPIIRNQEVCGFFELATKHPGGAIDPQSVSPLAEMVNTALDHLQAAEQAESRILEPGLEKPSGPALWHAPQPAAPVPLRIPTSAETPPLPDAKVQLCQSCGFPVSLGRTLCLDCEKLPASSAAIRELFTTDKQESWISAHAYTVASLLVTALAVAVILWLR